MESPKKLSVRSKFLLTIVACVVALSALMYVISSEVLLRSYARIEQESVIKDVARARDAIQDFGKQQTVKLQDWAQWDDAYKYALVQDQDFQETVLVASGLVNLDINGMLFVDPTGAPITPLVIDLETGEEVDPTSVVSRVLSERSLATHESLDSRTEGVIMLDEKPLLVSSLPLRTTDGGGPSTGALIFVRFLDDAKIADIGAVTHLAVSVFPYDGAELPEGVIDAKKTLSKDTPYVIEPMSSDTIVGYTTIYDINDQPILILKVEESRPIYTQGLLTFYLFMSVGGVAMLLFGALMVFLLERTVITRFVRLSSDVEKVNDGQDLSIRMQSSVKDEIGMLADKINQMLTWLGEAREAEAASRREIINLLDELKKEKEMTQEMSALIAKQEGSKR